MQRVIKSKRAALIDPWKSMHRPSCTVGKSEVLLMMSALIIDMGPLEEVIVKEWMRSCQ